MSIVCLEDNIGFGITMDNDNNEITNQLHFIYDLETNYLYGIKVKSLRDLSILEAVVNAFRSDEAQEEIRSLLSRQTHEGEDTGELFTIVENNLQIQILPRCLRRKIRLTTRLIYNEIKSFLTSPLIEKDKFLFLRFLVFNWQGFINPRETVLRVLESNVLSPMDSFIFSSKYLFIESKIIEYFNNLTPKIKGSILKSMCFVSHDLVFYWIQRFTLRNQGQPEDFESKILKDFKVLSSIDAFHRYFCTEIGVQYFYENMSPETTFIKSVILINLFEYPIQRINFSMYLFSKLQNDEIFIANADKILIRLVKVSRFRNIFIRYFKFLRNHVQTSKYLHLTDTVIKEMANMISIEYKYGKYFPMLRAFIALIPLSAKAFMINNHEKEYAKLLFELFAFHKVSFIYRFLSTEGNESYIKIGNIFNEFAITYFDMFSEAFHQCLNNIKTSLMELKPEYKVADEYEETIRVFLINITGSVDKVLHLIERLNFTFSFQHRV